MRIQLWLLAALIAAPLQAQEVKVELDHPDWVYHVNDTASWRISSSGDAKVRVLFTFEQQRLKPLSVDTYSVKANQPLIIKRTLNEPGLLRMLVKTTAGSDTAVAATAAFDPDKIKASVDMPSDFLEFWRSSIEEARRVPLNPVMTKMPERSNDDVDVYHINFQNTRNTRIYGILTMPKGPGPFPALLIVPGAGVRPYFPSYEWGKRGVITLSIGIHGIPVDRDSLFYNELRATALANYNTAQVEDRDKYYYRRVFVGCIKAGDFIFQLPQFDRKTYVVRGSSQGGGLSIITAALDPRVIAYSSGYPALSDHFGYLKSQVGGWPHIFADTLIKAKAEKMVTLPYYDAVNFARLIKVPGFFYWGFNDPVVPPHSMYAAYNLISAPKQVVVSPTAVHGAHANQREAEEKWLREKLGVR